MRWNRRILLAAVLATSLPMLPAMAQNDTDGNPAPIHSDYFDSGKLLATSGVSNIEGAGGAGLSTWATISGYETPNAVGANAHYTYIYLPDFTLQSVGTAVGLFDRVELSYAHQWFDTGSTGAALGLGKGFTFHQDIFGAKVKLVGDAVYDQDTWLPQIAAGVQYKINDRAAIIRAIGGKRSRDADYYVAATKLFLAQSLVVNATIRETRANQYGILGFGGDRNDDYTAQFEGSIGYLLSRKLAIGAEMRTKPSNLSFAKEGTAFDAFLVYFFSKNLSATLAFVSLGDIATRKDQNGAYLSLQAGF
jgi:hypothetical protein